MTPVAAFHYCPSCGEKVSAPSTTHRFQCPACPFVLYVNTTCATAAFVTRPDGRVLFIYRDKEPAKGKLAIPGGFIDPGENAEEALQREFLEEVGIKIHTILPLISAPNLYHYKNLTYPVLDFFYTARADHPDHVRALDGVASYAWLHPHHIHPADIAFPSMQRALAHYLAQPPA